jgi:hypothetical protein
MNWQTACSWWVSGHFEYLVLSAVQCWMLKALLCINWPYIEIDESIYYLLAFETSEWVKLLELMPVESGRAIWEDSVAKFLVMKTSHDKWSIFPMLWLTRKFVICDAGKSLLLLLLPTQNICLLYNVRFPKHIFVSMYGSPLLFPGYITC